VFATASHDCCRAKSHEALKFPLVMGLIATRSLTREIPGISELEKESEKRIRKGILADDALMNIRKTKNNATPELISGFDKNGTDLGYGFLLKRYVDDPRKATEAQIKKAACDTISAVFPMFWSFQIMVGLGFMFIGVMAYFFWITSFRGGQYPRWALRSAVAINPTPWIAAELG
jgi:cytochrome d ubiquinol oxidase subunit I